MREEEEKRMRREENRREEKGKGIGDREMRKMNKRGKRMRMIDRKKIGGGERKRIGKEVVSGRGERMRTNDDEDI